MDTQQWSPLFRGPTFRNDQDVPWGDACDPTKGGIYRLVALDEAGKPIVIDRLLSKDASGTLYVGCATNICGRLGKLCRTLTSGTNQGHTAAFRLVSEPALARRFPLSNIAITWRYHDYAEKAEATFTHNYKHAFGETPPLSDH